MSAEAAKVHALLQRGHTVDRLSDEQLQDVVAQIDSLKKSRQQQQQPAQPSPAELPAGKSPKSSKSSPCKGSAKKKRSPKKSPKADKSEAAEQEPEQEQESKAARRKRLHAGFMRFSRSLVSCSLSLYVYCVL